MEIGEDVRDAVRGLLFGPADGDGLVDEPPTPLSVWSRIRVNPSGCWLWEGATNGDGYGIIRVPGAKPRKVRMAHQVVYEEHKKPIPAGHVLHHRITCSTLCVNPDHLTPLTRSDHGKLHAGTL